jgi:hypothetical protein
MNNLNNDAPHSIHLRRQIFTEKQLSGIRKKEGKFYMRAEIEDKEVREENRKIRYLRFLVDFSILSIQQDDLFLREAQEIVENVKRAACSLFPGKEETFELIYRPRFNRAIQERFGFPIERGGIEST